MKFLLIMCCSLLVSVNAFGQASSPGSIDIFADLSYADCCIMDVVPGLVHVYIVHVYTNGARESWFRLDNPACNLMTYVGETTAGVDIPENSVLEGIGIIYGDCLVSPILLVTVHFFAQGMSPACCYLTMVPAPFAASGRIEALDCDYNLMFPSGGQAIINPTPECSCTYPVQGTTWGGIKSIYR